MLQNVNEHSDDRNQMCLYKTLCSLPNDLEQLEDCTSKISEELSDDDRKNFITKLRGMAELLENSPKKDEDKPATHPVAIDQVISTSPKKSNDITR